MQPGIYQVVNAYAAGGLLTAIGMSGVIFAPDSLMRFLSLFVVAVGIIIIMLYFGQQSDAINRWGNKPEDYP